MNPFNFLKDIYRTNFFKQKKEKFEAHSDAYYFHEDFYCQIEYLPFENFTSTSKIAKGVILNKEKVFDNYGWTRCYIRNGANIPTKSKKYSVSELAEFLAKEGFLEYPEVIAGYSSSVFRCDNKRAFKKQSIILCIDFEGELIENIWHNNSPHENDNEIYKQFLLKISDKYDVLLAD